MSYSIKTLSQLPLIIKGFRKERGLTQAVMAEKLGITQQSYAYFEANAATATLDRLFMVLRLLGVEISLDQVASVTSMSQNSSDAMGLNIVNPANRETGKTAGTEMVKKSSVTIKPDRIISITQENW